MSGWFRQSISQFGAIFEKLSEPILARPAISLTIATAFGCIFFLRDLPLLAAASLLLPASLIIYVIIRLAFKFFSARFGSGKTFVELILSAIILSLLYLLTAIPWWTAIFCAIYFFWLLYQAMSTRPGLFWTGFSALLVFFLFFLAHSILFLEQSALLYAVGKMEQRDVEKADIKLVTKEKIVTVVLDGNELLQFEKSETLKLRGPLDFKELSGSFPGAPAAVLFEGTNSLTPPSIGIFVLNRAANGDNLARLLGSASYRGEIEGLSPPAEDRISAGGLVFSGPRWTFIDPRSRRQAHLGFYCLDDADFAFVISEFDEPGFPHHPEILSVLGSIRIGKQSGRGKYCRVSKPV